MRKNILTVILIFTVLSGFGQKKSKIDSIRNLIKSETVDTLKVNYLNKIARSYYHTNPDSAFWYAKKALTISDSAKYIKGIAQAYRNIGVAYATKGEFNKSLKYLLISKNEFEKLNNKMLLTYIYTSIGIVFRKKSDFNSALEYYLKTQEIIEELNDSAKMTAIYNNIGVIYKIIKNYDKALDYYNRAILISEKIHKVGKIGYAYGNIALIYKETGRYKLSEDYFNKALKAFIKKGSLNQIANVYQGLADLYLKMNNFKKSLEYLLESNSIFIQISNKQGLAENLLIEGSVLLKQKKYQKAKKSYQNALKIFKISGAKESEMKSYFYLMKLDSLTFDFKSAFIYSQKYFKLKDSLFEINNVASIANIQYKYDLLQKENENIKLLKEKELKNEKIKKQQFLNIVTGTAFVASLIVLLLLFLLFKNTQKKNLLLKTKNQEINLQNTLLEERKERIDNQYEEIKVQNAKLEKYQNQLEDLVKEKTVKLNEALEIAQKSDRLKTEFLENLSHEIRTPLNAIVGFTELYKKDTKNVDINPVFIFGVQKSIDDLLHTINRLIIISRYQVGEYELNPEKLNLSVFFNKQKEKISERRVFLEKEKIDLEFNYREMYIKRPFVSDESVLNLILSELIENAFKFTHSGTISIDAKIDKNQLCFSVKDTGMGIKKETLAYIFDLLRKFDDENELFRGMGVGLAIVKKAVEILSGTITVETIPNEGAEFKIIIPEILLTPEL